MNRIGSLSYGGASLARWGEGAYVPLWERKVASALVAVAAWDLKGGCNPFPEVLRVGSEVLVFDEVLDFHTTSSAVQAEAAVLAAMRQKALATYR